MGRHTGPVERLSRREGVELELKGLRRLAGKSGLDRRGALPPGEHGGRRRRPPSTFALQLRAKQVLKRMYGVRERQFRRYVREAQASRDRTGDRIVLALERRLDNVIYRLGFATTRAQARQFVSHGHVFVDGRRVNIPSYRVKPGQVIGLRTRARSGRPRPRPPNCSRASRRGWRPTPTPSSGACCATRSGRTSTSRSTSSSSSSTSAGGSGR